MNRLRAYITEMKNRTAFRSMEHLGKWIIGPFLSFLFVMLLPILSYPKDRENTAISVAFMIRDGLFPIHSYLEKGNPGIHKSNEISFEYLNLEDLEARMDEENAAKRKETVEVTLVGVDPERIERERAERKESFVKSKAGTLVNEEYFATYEERLKHYYTIDGVTSIEEGEIDFDKLLNMDLTITKSSEEMQILIYHTHSQEGFADSVPGDENTTIMGVGEYLASVLREEYGYQVYHHLGKYDVESRDNAYARSLPEIKQFLDEHPSIDVVIDLHRDGIDESSGKLVTNVGERETAKFMFFNGISKTNKQGHISYLENPYLQENLAFALQMKQKADAYYPGVTRKNYINGYRYNMHLKARTLLVELGAQNNTVEEARNACDIIAHLLDMVLTGE